MAITALRIAAFGVSLAAFSVLAFGLPGEARAGMPVLAPAAPHGSPVIAVSRDGPRFHHGKRAQSVYCLRRNYWWFYRPYTTAQENYPRCEPYFHYPEQVGGQGGGYADPGFK